jgi:hypothetical protein
MYAFKIAQIVPEKKQYIKAFVRVRSKPASSLMYFVLVVELDDV